MPPLPWRRIARLLPAERKRALSGTGFVIDDRHLLTAFHVIGDRQARRVYDGPVEVELHDHEDPAHWITISAQVVAGQHDADHDWALVRCDAAIPDVAPVALRHPRAGYDDAWTSYGYAGLPTELGKAYHGEITSYAPDLQIYCKEAQGAPVQGLSGAPCLVGGRAIGIITSASDPDRSGLTLDGTLFVRSIADIAARSDVVRALLPAREPPFVPQVESELVEPRLWPLFPELKKVGPGWTLPAVPLKDRITQAPDVAERLLLASARDALRALKLLYPLGRARSRAILDEFIASVWIDDQAAAALAAAIRAGAPRTIVGLNLERPAMCERYVHRAGYPVEGHPGWQKLAHGLQGGGGERRKLAPAAIEVLQRRLGCDDLDELKATYAGHDHAGEPLVLVVPPAPPPPAEVDAFHADFPMVRLLMLCGTGGIDALARDFPGATIVEPRLRGAQESAALAEHHAALIELDRFYDDREKATP